MDDRAGVAQGSRRITDTLPIARAQEALVVTSGSAPVAPALVAASGERAHWRFLEFFTAHIRNPNTRRAYGRDVSTFLTWCAAAGVRSLAEITPFHVAGYLDQRHPSRESDIWNGESGDISIGRLQLPFA
ncbi:site-specific integrase [uncultured Enterovirga sp.]|uniref:site-specific integrase n=1 Tax=uncultured Enterovirga sp. TaxID=2026352 RepID=UPI0035C95B62